VTRVQGAVLVGGRSVRMGAPKSLIPIDGVPMARRVADAMRRAGCGRIVAVGPRHLAAGLRTVPDRHPGEGPLGGILTALGAASGDPVVVAACDLPWLDASAIEALLAHVDDDVDVVVARTSRLEPLCALWQPSAAAPVQRAFDGGERAVHRALKGVRVLAAAVAEGALTNVNTPADLPGSVGRDLRRERSDG
jgi:molybdopterin-guanine dinucleotide biosynthesis protein A